MDVVIHQHAAGAHSISKYQFKILSSLSGMSVGEAAHEMNSIPVPEPVQERHKEESKSSKDELIESLLKKADEMSSNVIKMQMRIESMQEEHASAL